MDSVMLHLMNDDYNHHMDVETALKQVCSMEEEIAQVTAMIAHTTGYCPIFEGNADEAKTLQEKLEDMGINTQITDVGSDPL